MEKYIKIVKVAGLFLPIALIVYLFFSSSEPEHNPEVTFDPGKNEGLISYTYDKNNNISMVIKSSESFPEVKGTKLKNVVIKKIKKNKDLGNIHITSDEGFIDKGMHHITITGNSKIVSKNMTMEGREFFLLGQNEVNSKEPVNYYSKRYRGVGNKGAKFYLKQKLYRFFDAEGEFTEGDKKYNYTTDLLWFWDAKNIVIFEKNNVIKGKNSLIECQKMDIYYTPDRKHLKYISSYKGSRMVTGTKEAGDYREMQGDHIDSRYPSEGKLDLIYITSFETGSGRLKLITKKDILTMKSREMKIRFDPETGKMVRVEMLRVGKVTVEGEEPFNIDCRMLLIYFEGENISRFEAKDVSNFELEDYSGSTPQLNYNYEKKLAHLKGTGSRIFQKNNRFTSTSFFINTEKKLLSSKSRVKSFIHKKANQTKSFLSKGEIMINAGNFTIDDNKGTVKYGGKVQLIQEDLNLKTNKLNIPPNGDIITEGKSLMTFNSTNNDIEMKGDKILMDAENSRIYLYSEDGTSKLTITQKEAEKSEEDEEVTNSSIEKSTSLKEVTAEKEDKLSKNETLSEDKEEADSSSLSADTILIEMGEKKAISFITGKRDVKFKKGKIEGSSNSVKWFFNKQLMIFRGKASLGNSDGSVEKGDILELLLDKNLIITKAKGRSRTETLIK